MTCVQVVHPSHIADMRKDLVDTAPFAQGKLHVWVRQPGQVYLAAAPHSLHTRGPACKRDVSVSGTASLTEQNAAEQVPVYKTNWTPSRQVVYPLDGSAARVVAPAHRRS